MVLEVVEVVVAGGKREGERNRDEASDCDGNVKAFDSAICRANLNRVASRSHGVRLRQERGARSRPKDYLTINKCCTYLEVYKTFLMSELVKLIGGILYYSGTII